MLHSGDVGRMTFEAESNLSYFVAFMCFEVVKWKSWTLQRFFHFDTFK